MKRNRLFMVATLAAASVLGLTGCGDAAHEEEQKEPTEVAVQTAKVVRATLRQTVVAHGVVEPEPATSNKPAASARLASPVAGIVVEANAVEGQRVAKGAKLYRLDSRAADAAVERARRNVEKAQQTVEKARQVIEKVSQAAKFAELNWERQQRLVKVDGTSQKLLQEAEAQLAAARSDVAGANVELASANSEVASARAELAAAETQRALLTIEAPFTGTLTRVNTKPGEAVELNTVLAELVDLDRLVVSASLPGAELAAVKLGQAVELTSGTTKATGSVVFISPEMDAKTGTALLRVSAPGDAGLRPGQFLRLRIVTEERPGRLAVPRESVYTDHDGQSTLSIVEGDVAKQKVVKVGLRDGPLVEVEGEGVTEGATVVTLGSYALPKETKVRILNTLREAK